MQECKVAFVEYAEEIFPGDLFELFLGVAKIDPQHAALAGRPDEGRPALPCLYPFTDLVMVGGGCCFAHRTPPSMRPPNLRTAGLFLHSDSGAVDGFPTRAARNLSVR